MDLTKCLMLMFIVAFVSASTMVSAQDPIYKWVDEQGVVHFGDRPDTSKKAEIFKVDSPPPSSPANANAGNQQSDAETNPYAQQSEGDKSPAQIQREERAEKRRIAAEEKETTDRLCRHYREVVVKLEPFPRVIATTASGQVYRMDDNERLEKLDQAKDFVAKNCD